MAAAAAIARNLRRIWLIFVVRPLEVLSHGSYAILRIPSSSNIRDENGVVKSGRSHGSRIDHYRRPRLGATLRVKASKQLVVLGLLQQTEDLNEKVGLLIHHLVEVHPDP